MGPYYLSHPVNIPSGRKPEYPKKTHDFRQGVDYTLFTRGLGSYSYLCRLKFLAINPLWTKLAGNKHFISAENRIVLISLKDLDNDKDIAYKTSVLIAKN